jgi:hypothetical protein
LAVRQRLAQQAVQAEPVELAETSVRPGVLAGLADHRLYVAEAARQVVRSALVARADQALPVKIEAAVEAVRVALPAAHL